MKLRITRYEIRMYKKYERCTLKDEERNMIQHGVNHWAKIGYVSPSKLGIRNISPIFQTLNLAAPMKLITNSRCEPTNLKRLVSMFYLRFFATHFLSNLLIEIPVLLLCLQFFSFNIFSPESNLFTYRCYINPGSI